MYSIGKFSILTRITVKTLRRYHDRGLLVADYVDEDTGYRYYKEDSIARAQIIKQLREFDCSLAEIQDLLQNAEEDQQILDFLIARREEFRKQQVHYKKMQQSLDFIIENAQRYKEMSVKESVQVKKIESMLIAGHKITGAYPEIARAFKILGRKAGRYINGSAMGIFYDEEYREADANFAGAFPVKKEVRGADIFSEVLPGGDFISTLHQGPYNRIPAAYQRLLAYAGEQELKLSWPAREIYLKGPGMIFKGNPEKYITEVLIPVQVANSKI